MTAPAGARAKALAARGAALAAAGEARAAADTLAGALRLAPADVALRERHQACVQAAAEEVTAPAALLPAPRATRPLAPLARLPPRAALTASSASPALPDRLLTLTTLRHAPHSRDAHAFAEVRGDTAAPARARDAARDGPRIRAAAAGAAAAVRNVTAMALTPIVLDLGGGGLAGAGAAAAARSGATRAVVAERWAYSAATTRQVLDANG